ncbi:MAG: hypothetical protein ACJAWY_001008 [Sphingomonas echinoides]|jgi:hypothetical protein
MADHHWDKRIDRRGMLECMGWAGTGTLFALAGGITGSLTLDQAIAATPKAGDTAVSAVKPFSFLQISDTHIGFKKAANPDVIGTLKETIAKVRALAVQPDFIVHTGDVTHLAQGFPLVGGRLDYIGDRPVAALVYRRRLHTINLFIRPAPQSPAASPGALRRHTYTIERWVAGDLEYWAVSDVDAADLRAFHKLFAAASAG